MALSRADARLIAEELGRIVGSAGRGGGAAAGGGTGGLDPEQQEKYEAALNRIMAQQETLVELSAQEEEISQNKIQRLEQERALKEAIKSSNDAAARAAENEIIALDAEIARLEKKRDTIQEAADAAADLADSFGNLFTGEAPDLKGMLKPENIQGLATNFGKLTDAKMLTKAAGLAAVDALKKYAEATVNLAIDLGDAEIGFMKATGANQEFARSLTNSFAETRTFGASVEETSAAAQGLFTTFTDFTMVSQQTRESLTETATVMGKLGVSNQDFAQSIQTSTKAMGMSAAQASQNMLDLEKFSRDLGVAPSELAGQFAGARDMLAKLGSDGTRAFKDLAIAAKTTGMSIENIVNLTNKFDTFEGAAQQAGQLNAALGGNFVNAMDLMMATNPAERFDMIRDSILDAGLSFDEMSYYQKQFYRDSLGLSDVGELAALMSGDMDLVAGATEETGQSMIDAKKRAQELASFQDRLNMAFAQMIPIITPLIDLFSDFTKFVAENATTIKVITGIIIALGSALLGPVGATAALVLGLSLIFDSIKVGEDKVSALSIIFGQLKDAFYVVIEPISQIFDAFSELFAMFGDTTGGGGTLFLVTLLAKGLARSLTAFLLPLTMGARVINIFVQLIRSMYRGLTGADDALEPLIDSLKAFFGITFKLLDPLIFIAYQFDIFKDAINGVAEFLFEKQYASNFLEGIVKIGNAFSAMAVGVAETLNPFTAMERVIDSIGNAFTNIISAVSSFFMVITDPTAAENVMKIGEAITAIPTRKNLEFVGSMGSLAAANTAAAALGAVENVTNVITGNTGAGGSPTPYEVTINVMLERDKLATVTKEIVGEMSRDAARQGA